MSDGRRVFASGLLVFAAAFLLFASAVSGQDVELGGAPPTVGAPSGSGPPSSIEALPAGPAVKVRVGDGSKTPRWLEEHLRSGGRPGAEARAKTQSFERRVHAPRTERIPLETPAVTNPSDRFVYRDATDRSEDVARPTRSMAERRSAVEVVRRSRAAGNTPASGGAALPPAGP